MSSHRSKIAVDIPESEDTTSEDLDEKRKLSRDMRKAAEGRARYGDFEWGDFDQSADIFFCPGYYRVETIKRIQECDRDFFIAHMRKKYPGPNMAKCTRLAIDLLETFQTKMKNARGPKIEEAQIPREVKKRPPLWPP